MASAVGSPQRQLSLVLQGLRDHHSPVGGVHMQGEGVLQPTQGFERKHREAGVGYRPVLLQGMENTHWRRTHKAEAGKVVPMSSGEVFFQVSPRWWPFQEEACGLWDRGGVTHLATGMGKGKKIKQMDKEMRNVTYGATLTPQY